MQGYVIIKKKKKKKKKHQLKKKKRGRPEISRGSEVLGSMLELARTPQELASDDGDSISEIQDPDWKGEIEILGPKKDIIKKAQSLCEDSALFKDPFPNFHQEVITRVDARNSTARICDFKAEILEREEKRFKYVGNLAEFCVCPNLE